MIHVYYKEKVYSVNVTGINQDWTCGWGKEKRYMWYIIKKNGVYCKCVLFGCVYILHV